MITTQTTLADLWAGKVPDRDWERRILRTKSSRKANGEANHVWIQACVLSLYKWLGDVKAYDDISRMVREMGSVNGGSVKVCLQTLCNRGFLQETVPKMFRRVR